MYTAPTLKDFTYHSVNLNITAYTHWYKQFKYHHINPGTPIRSSSASRDINLLQLLVVSCLLLLMSVFSLYATDVLSLLRPKNPSHAPLPTDFDRSRDLWSVNSLRELQLERREGLGAEEKGVQTHHGNRSHPDQYLIYHCTGGCGGWADRLKGIVIGYLLAGLTGRRFGIRVKDTPCPLTHFLVPSQVKWEVGEEEAPTSGATMVNKMDDPRFLQDLATEDLNQIFKGRVVLFKANLDYFDKIKANPHYKEQLRWMQNLTRDQIFARLFRELFTLSPHVQETLKAVRPASTSTRLVCAHLRFADNTELFRDSVKRHTTEHGETVIKFLQTFDPSHASYNATRTSAAMTPPVTSADVRFFVTSDSQAFMDKAGKVFRERFVATTGRVMHVDKLHVDKLGEQQQQQACEAVSKVVVDQQLLSTCHVLLISKSGLSRQAAYLRGTDRGLYCVLMDGTVHKCSPSNVRDLYQVLG